MNFQRNQKNRRNLFRLLSLVIIFSISSFIVKAEEIILEAEDGTMVGGAEVQNYTEGFSGTGYVTNFEVEGEDGVTVSLTLEEAGEYTISLGYNSLYGPKDNFLKINGVVVDTVHFDQIDEFTEINVGDYTLNKGTNTISFFAYWGWCLLDYIKVSDIAPRGEFSVDPSSPATGDTITFDASACYDPNGSITSYEWNFNGEGADTGSVVKYVFTNEGVKTVSLTLTDNDGNTSLISKQISVSRAEPYAVYAVSPELPEPSVAITFDGSLSYDLTGTIDAYEWDFGDGTTSTEASPSHTYASEGDYKVILKVTNNRDKTDLIAKTIFVYNSDKVLRGPAVLTANPKTNEKIELAFDVNADYTNPFDPAQVMVDFVYAPEGTTDSIVVPCFYYTRTYYRLDEWHTDSTTMGWRARLLIEDAGNYAGKLRYTGTSVVYGDPSSFSVTEGTVKGMVRNDSNNPQYYRRSTGEPFYPMGINIAWNEMENYDEILQNITNYNANLFRYWHTPFDHSALEWSEDDFYGGLVQYNQVAAGKTDSLIGMGEKYGALIQLTMLQHGPFSSTVDPIWPDNPYNSANGGFIEDADDFFSDTQCKFYIKKLFRYIVARWGYSPNIFAWEFFNEVQFSGNFPSQSTAWANGVMQWHSEMSRYIESIDPYNHIMTTSASDDQLYDLDTVAELDVIQYHLYSAQILEAQKDHDYMFTSDLETPIINGEYGGGDNADISLNKQKISLWNGIFTQVPHIMWLWDNYDEEEWGEVFDYPTRYLEDEDFAAMENLVTADFAANADDEEVASTFMKSDSSFYGVVYDEDGGVLQGVQIDSIAMPYGYYDIKFYIQGSSKIEIREDVPFIRAYNSLSVPAGANDIAIKAVFSSDYLLPIAIAGDDQLIALGTVATLDGSSSINPQGGSLNYNWQLLDKPSSSTLSIEGSQATISVTPDASGYYTFCLTVDDGTNYSVQDTVIITASSMPIANAGDDVSIRPGVLGLLDGTASYDPDGEDITYLWQVISTPEGASAQLYKDTEAESYMRADSLGEYKVILTVDDGIQPSEPDTVVVTVSENSAIQSVSAESVKIYPNPASDLLNLELKPGNGILNNISITSVSGKLVFCQDVDDYDITGKRTLQIDLNSISDSKGVYIIHMSFSNGVIVKSLVIM